MNNLIAMSLDQNMAIREDGIKPVAVKRIPDGQGCCVGCAAMQEPAIASCFLTALPNRLCQKSRRKDNRFIRWEALK